METPAIILMIVLSLALLITIGNIIFSIKSGRHIGGVPLPPELERLAKNPPMVAKDIKVNFKDNYVTDSNWCKGASDNDQAMTVQRLLRLMQASGAETIEFNISYFGLDIKVGDRKRAYVTNRVDPELINETDKEPLLGYIIENAFTSYIEQITIP